jgi:Reverse transcriptase (RNA-dependent DNA polymerase)
MILLAKKEAVCHITDTRPISLLDVFLKITEKLFLTRFQKILENRGILHDSQSGFRANFRLQSRVLLLVDQIASAMSNSAPTATLFIDFKQAFDQFWWEGCPGKIRRLGIPKAFVLWIETWLKGRVGFFDMNGERSREFPIFRGGPQGSCLTPTIFITYHSDMWTFLLNSLPNFFADDLACVMSGRIGVKYTQQCIDLEIRLKELIDYLEFYAILALQPINYDKTVGLWSARAIGAPQFDIEHNGRTIKWVKSFKYLEYLISSKLGWGPMIATVKTKIRQRTAIVKSCRIAGETSSKLKRVLFFTFAFPIFAWMFALFPLLTDCQRVDLSHFYFTCLRRILGASPWNDYVFAATYQERALENRCHSYWAKFLSKLSCTTDGALLFEHCVLCEQRESWREKETQIKSLHRSKRFVQHTSAIVKCLNWFERSDGNSIPEIDEETWNLFYEFPESFM